MTGHDRPESAVTMGWNTHFMFFDVRDSTISAEDRQDLEARLRKEDLWSASAVRARTIRDVTYPFAPTLAARVGRIGKKLTEKVVGGAVRSRRDPPKR